MAIPIKLFSRLTDSLIEYRKNPTAETDHILLSDEEECNWPWDASTEQKAEWQAICDRTRDEFEFKVRKLKGL